MDPQVAFRALIEKDLELRQVKLNDVHSLDKFYSNQITDHLDTQQIIAAAKAACEVIKVLDNDVCPFIRQLP